MNQNSTGTLPIEQSHSIISSAFGDIDTTNSTYTRDAVARLIRSAHKAHEEHAVPLDYALSVVAHALSQVVGLHGVGSGTNFHSDLALAYQAGMPADCSLTSASNIESLVRAWARGYKPEMTQEHQQAFGRKISEEDSATYASNPEPVDLGMSLMPEWRTVAPASRMIAWFQRLTVDQVQAAYDSGLLQVAKDSGGFGAVGTNVAQYLAAHAEHGVSFYEFQGWKNARTNVPIEEAMQYGLLLIGDIEKLRKLKVDPTFSKSVQKYLTRGGYDRAVHLAAAQKAGLTNPAEYKEWVDLTQDSRLAVKCYSSGISLSDARELVEEHGVEDGSILVASRLHDAEVFKQYEDIVSPFRTFDAQAQSEVARYIYLGGSPRNLTSALRCGVPLNDATEYIGKSADRIFRSTVQIRRKLMESGALTVGGMTYGIDRSHLYVSDPSEL